MTGMAIGSILSAAVGAYSAYEQDKSADKAAKQQEEALRKAEEEALKEGPKATTLSEEDSGFEEARKNLLRRGFYGTIRNSMTGLGGTATTGGTGLKGTLG